MRAPGVNLMPITPANPLPPDRGHLLTEQRLHASSALDGLTVEEVLRVINEQDATLPAVVGMAIPRIAKLVEAVVRRMRKGGRLIYLGAGTSGRLGVLDASECPPTFHIDSDRVVGIIAGGDTALRQSSEGREDEIEGARAELERLNVGGGDVVIGIAAGGTTPYVLGGIRIAKQLGAATSLLCCVTQDQLSSTSRAGASPPPVTPDLLHALAAIDHLITLPVGAEVITGSTRMKAGTATKLVLNMISTTTMVQLGKVWGNLMIDLRATNAKLRDRAARIIASQCDVPREQAMLLLDRADGRVKLALVMAKKGIDAEAATKLLEHHGQQLRPIIGEPR
jgi:N-acetylmuramic acid 6-phosphate etherase